MGRFGAEMVLAREVIGFESRGPVRAVFIDGAEKIEIEARALIVASGVAYRHLNASGVDQLTGRGVYYGVNASEASQCHDDEVYLVGGANSAGQAALNLARFAKRVVLVVRAASLKDSMSQYLIDRIEAALNIDVRYRSEVTACEGNVGAGTGLGLDIAQRIVVERHSGTIEIDSRPGSTIMRVRLPIRSGS